MSTIKDTEFDNNAKRTVEVKNSWFDHALIHDVIKIKYVNLGYVGKNYPPHLISDEEMIYAFLPPESDESKYDIYFFNDHYPCLPKLSENLIEAYNVLKSDIRYHLDKFLDDKSDRRTLPDWVYSYMLGVPLSVLSDKQDIHDYLVIIGNDNIDDLYEADTAEITYDLSQKYLGKYPNLTLDHRPATIFAEPHVIKYANILYNESQYVDDEER